MSQKKKFLILGCTHYSLIKTELNHCLIQSDINNITIIDPSEYIKFDGEMSKANLNMQFCCSVASPENNDKIASAQKEFLFKLERLDPILNLKIKILPNEITCF